MKEKKTHLFFISVPPFSVLSIKPKENLQIVGNTVMPNPSATLETDVMMSIIANSKQKRTGKDRTWSVVPGLLDAYAEEAE